MDGRLAKIIEALIEHNKIEAPDDTVRPLFRTPSARRTLIGGPLADYAYHHTAYGITALIAECAKRLAVVSPRTKMPLVLTTRRLRYTFASKMVRQGVTARDLAELLDHTDTQHVQVYYKADSRFVERLDATVAVHLGPTIKAFMGEVVVRPKLTIDLIPFRELPALGACGASFSCGLVGLERARDAGDRGQAKNWVEAQERVLRTARAALAIDDDPNLKIGQAYAVNPDGPNLGEPL